MDTHPTEYTFLVAYHNRLCADGIKSILYDYYPNTKVDTVENGRKLFEALKLKKYDLLIIDLIYPGCDSINYILQIKKCNKSLKILLISLSNKRHDKEFDFMPITGC